jgi:transposase
MEIITMSAKEISRLEIMQKLDEKKMSQKEAMRILNLGVHQIKRLLKAYRERGSLGTSARTRFVG